MSGFGNLPGTNAGKQWTHAHAAGDAFQHNGDRNQNTSNSDGSTSNTNGDTSNAHGSTSNAHGSTSYAHGTSIHYNTHYYLGPSSNNPYEIRPPQSSSAQPSRAHSSQGSPLHRRQETQYPSSQYDQNAQHPRPTRGWPGDRQTRESPYSQTTDRAVNYNGMYSAPTRYRDDEEADRYSSPRGQGPYSNQRWPIQEDDYEFHRAMLNDEFLNQRPWNWWKYAQETSANDNERRQAMVDQEFLNQRPWNLWQYAQETNERRRTMAEEKFLNQRPWNWPKYAQENFANGNEHAHGQMRSPLPGNRFDSRPLNQDAQQRYEQQQQRDSMLPPIYGPPNFQQTQPLSRIPSRPGHTDLSPNYDYEDRAGREFKDRHYDGRPGPIPQPGRHATPQQNENPLQRPPLPMVVEPHEEELFLPRGRRNLDYNVRDDMELGRHHTQIAYDSPYGRSEDDLSLLRNIPHVDREMREKPILTPELRPTQERGHRQTKSERRNQDEQDSEKDHQRPSVTPKSRIPRRTKSERPYEAPGVINSAHQPAGQQGGESVAGSHDSESPLRPCVHCHGRSVTEPASLNTVEHEQETCTEPERTFGEKLDHFRKLELGASDRTVLHSRGNDNTKSTTLLKRHSPDKAVVRSEHEDHKKAVLQPASGTSPKIAHQRRPTLCRQRKSRLCSDDSEDGASGTDTVSTNSMASQGRHHSRPQEARQSKTHALRHSG